MEALAEMPLRHCAICGKMAAMTLLDMVGPVMVGPSSSHTAGACRIGLAAHHLLGGVPKFARIGLHESFAKTGRGHGTHFALVAGLLGYPPHDPRLPGSFNDARALGMEFSFHNISLADVHPNTALLEVEDAAGKPLTVLASSTGGGVIVVVGVNGFGVKLSAAYPTLVLEVPDRQGVLAAVTGALAAEGLNIATMSWSRDRRGGNGLIALELDVKPANMAAIEAIDAELGVHSVRQMPKLMDG